MKKYGVFLLFAHCFLNFLQSTYTLLHLFFLYLFIYLFIFGCVGSQLQHAGSSLRLWLLCSCGAQTPEHMSSVVCGRWALQLRCAGSVVAARGLSCPTACGILVPRSGIEPASPALGGGLFTTGPPGKSLHFIIFKMGKKLFLTAFCYLGYRQRDTRYRAPIRQKVFFNFPKLSRGEWSSVTMKLYSRTLFRDLDFFCLLLLLSRLLSFSHGSWLTSTSTFQPIGESGPSRFVFKGMTWKLNASFSLIMGFSLVT